MEVFLWCASGQRLLDTISSKFPTILAYTIDTEKCVSPAIFMSNLFYTCSLMSKTGLPTLLTCTKTDLQDEGYITEWMTNVDAFTIAVKDEQERHPDGSGGERLLRSMGYVLEEFRSHLHVIRRRELLIKGRWNVFSDWIRS
jgi:GPN-loop GTPase